MSAVVRAALGRERSLAFVLALLTAGVAFEPRIKVGGFNADDWPGYVATRFPQVDGAHSAVGALEQAAGSRIGHMLYWLASYSLFGSHTRLYTMTAALLAVMLAFSVYLLLRELRFSVAQSLAMMVLTIVLPSVEAQRFWFTPAGGQICLSLLFLGLTLALRAFAAPQEKRLRLHLASWMLYLASAAYAETALPLMGLSVLVYLTRADLITSLRRWAVDIPIVVGGYLATLSFVSSKSGFGKLPSSMWGEHARLMADQALTIFARLLGPLSADDRPLGLTGVGIVATAGFVLWRRGNISVASRRELQRWGYTFLVCLVAIVVSYAVFVPAMLYYEPLGPGLATHINIVTAAPLGVGVFALLMLTRIVCAELVDGLVPRAGRLLMALVLVWYAVIVFEATKNVRSDGHIWALASAKDFHVLHMLTVDLPHPIANATVYTFGEAGTVAPGMPIFFTSWEQNSAVKIAYNRPDVSSYPIVVSGIQPSCTARGVTANVGSAAVSSPSPYGRSYFFDIPSGQHELIGSAATCTTALSEFHPGPYAITPPLEWSQ